MSIINTINQSVSKSVNQVRPFITAFDARITTLIPNPKTKKILYIAVGSLFGFMFLIILLGLLLSPLKNQTKSNGTILNKPNITNATAKPEQELSATRKQILELETKVKELRFPESILNVPILESDIKIEND